MHPNKACHERPIARTIKHYKRRQTFEKINKLVFLAAIFFINYENKYKRYLNTNFNKVHEVFTPTKTMVRLQ